jgi:hypothetical protein
MEPSRPCYRPVAALPFAMKNTETAMKTILKLAVGLSALLAATSALAEKPLIGKVSLLGQIVLPTGLTIGGVEFGGVSGLDYDAGNDLFYAISDDRSQKAPARLYILKLAIAESGVQGIDIVSTIQLSDATGKPFAEKDIDPEAIRYDAAAKKLYWSSEGDAKGRPAVYEAGLDGKAVRSFELPDYYLPNADGSQGARNNLAFEGLTISADGKTLWAGTENALAQDGDKATLEAGSRSRLIGFDLGTGAPVREYAYDTGPIFAKATKVPYYNDNGLSDMLALDDNSVLIVERSFALGIGTQINLYIAGFAGATDVKDMRSLKAAAVKPLTKRHVLKIGEGDFGLDIDNIEAVTFGPEIGGKRTLVVASDNNFNPDGQFTQFVVFTLDPAAM